MARIGVAPAGTFPQFDVDFVAGRDDRRDRVDHVHLRGTARLIGRHVMDEASRDLIAELARAKTQIHIAAAYLELRDYEKADQVTAEALITIGTLSSSRIVERVKGLRRRANRRHNDLDERIADFLN
jgi:hypothetical protein